jgi:hypothetical protein
MSGKPTVANQACAREQMHFDRILDDVIIGNQIALQQKSCNSRQ